MSERPSWRDRDRRNDRSAHRRDEPSRSNPRNASASARYKRQLDSIFQDGELPAHLKEKLSGLEGAPEEGGRQALLRGIRKASSGQELERAVEALLKEHELPQEVEILIRVLEHPKDAVLLKALQKLETLLEAEAKIPKRALLRRRLQGLEFSSFDPRVQQRAVQLAARL